MSGDVVLMTLLGGLGTIFGPVAGAAYRRARELPRPVRLLGTVTQGAIFVVCVLAFRRGIIGEIGAPVQNLPLNLAAPSPGGRGSGEGRAATARSARGVCYAALHNAPPLGYRRSAADLLFRPALDRPALVRTRKRGIASSPTCDPRRVPRTYPGGRRPANWMRRATPDLGLICRRRPSSPALAAAPPMVGIAGPRSAPGAPGRPQRRRSDPRSLRHRRARAPASTRRSATSRQSPGKLALVSPRSPLCRAVLDWAEPNGVGFSHIVGTRARGRPRRCRHPRHARPRTRRGRHPARRPHRAATAAPSSPPPAPPPASARSWRCMPAPRHVDPSGRHDLVFAAALRRAGILRVDHLRRTAGRRRGHDSHQPPRWIA